MTHESTESRRVVPTGILNEQRVRNTTTFPFRPNTHRRPAELFSVPVGIRPNRPDWSCLGSRQLRPHKRIDFGREPIIRLHEVQPADFPTNRGRAEEFGDAGTRRDGVVLPANAADLRT